jgi:cobalt-zinc-cadmium efflux system protein
MTASHDHDHDHGRGHDHGHRHDHGHHHGHSHVPEKFDRAFAIGIAVNGGFVAIELVAGLYANSLGLLADAGHNLSDVLTLALAWAASWLAGRRPTQRRTYGLRKSSILAALSGAVIQLIGVGAIALEAAQRLVHPQPVLTGWMIWVALAGIAVNAGTALPFWRGRKHDLNLQAAFLHLITDAVLSAGVVIAALLMQTTGWQWLDPAISLGIVAAITLGSWSLLRDSVNLAIDGVPAGVDHQAVAAFLAGLPGVQAVHDLHIWGLSTTEIALTAHLLRPDHPIDDGFLEATAATLASRFAIAHATIQVEAGNGAGCRLASPETI